MSEALEHLLDCPFCGSPAELQEWEERDATRWAAQANCTGCRAEGPRGYANNDLGCYDAVNDLHKKRAIEGWNKRAPEIRTNVGSDNLSDQDRKEMDDALKEWAKSPEAAREALLETIDLKAQAGLESDNNFATRGLYLKDIRKIIKEARDAQ